MNNECNSELKMCRFCQQFMMCDEDGTAESVCMCDGAIKERNRQMAAADLLASVNKCCGEDCNTEYPDFAPVSPDILELATVLVEQISKSNVMKATLDLGDDTRLSISCTKVVRRRVAKAEVSR